MEANLRIEVRIEEIVCRLQQGSPVGQPQVGHVVVRRGRLCEERDALVRIALIPNVVIQG